MNKLKFLSLLLFISSFVGLYAQTKLSDSPQASAGYLVYKINQQDLRKMYIDEKVDESIFHTYVTSIAERNQKIDLERGNYILVGADKDELKYFNYPVDNFVCKIVPAEKLMICLHDTLGNIIDDAVVKRGRKSIKFDKKTQTYNASKVKDEDILEVYNNGVYHYVELEDDTYKYKRSLSERFYSFKNRVRSLFRRNSYKYYHNSGFIVFSKPKYKPGETVKLKAYIADKKNKPYKDEVRVRLQQYQSKIDTLLTTLKPYRPGMYEYEFVLNDSLKLQLDRHYDIVLKTEDGTNLDSEGFKYEEYELKSVTFSAEANKTEHSKRDTVKIKFSAVDENSLPVYDGRVEITATPTHSKMSVKGMRDLFIPNVLWRDTIFMSGISEKEIVVPDSIFPEYADLNYSIKSRFFTTDNEMHEKTLSFSLLADEYKIEFTQNNGLITVRQLHNGVSMTTDAVIEGENEELETVYKERITLPYTFPVSWLIESYTVKSEQAEESYYAEEEKVKHPFNCNFYIEGDSVYLNIDNPANIPLWYFVRSKDKTIKQGYTSSNLNQSFRNKKKEGMEVLVSYLWGEEPKTLRKNVSYNEKNISMTVITPGTVYPGQTTEVNFLVQDKKGKGVKNVDITAYAYTSKFNKKTPPGAIYGKTKTAKRFEPLDLEYDTDYTLKNNLPLDVDKWNKKMGLDSMEFYRFLNPKYLYTYSEPALNKRTQLAPYVVLDGRVYQAALVWVDGRLHYAEMAENSNIYSFNVSWGKHKIKMRIYDRIIEIDDVELPQGMKTILSVDGSIDSQRIRMTKLEETQKGRFTGAERNDLNKNLLLIDNNFGRLMFGKETIANLPAYIASNGTIYKLGNPLTTYNHASRVSTAAPSLVGPFPYKHRSKVANSGILYLDFEEYARVDLTGGYHNTIYNNYQKMRSWDDNTIPTTLRKGTPKFKFKDNTVVRESIREDYQKAIIERMQSRSGRLYLPMSQELSKKGMLKLRLGYWKEKDIPIKPYLIFVEGLDEDNPNHLYLYSGGTREFYDLPSGRVNINLIFSDSTYYTYPIEIKNGGVNCLKIERISSLPLDPVSNSVVKLFESSLEKDMPINPYSLQGNKSSEEGIESLKERETVLAIDNNEFVPTPDQVSGIVWDEEFEEPVIGASVFLSDDPNVNAISDINGRFILNDVSGYNQITIAAIGYERINMLVKSGNNYNVYFTVSESVLNEVEIIASGWSPGSSLDGVTDISRALEGRAAGVSVQNVSGTFGYSPKMRIRGASSIYGDVRPLWVVDGVVLEGGLDFSSADLSSDDAKTLIASVIAGLNADDIESFNIIKDASATALYGARAMNGVIVVTTKGKRSNQLSLDSEGADSDDKLLGDEMQGNVLRRNFHDDAFWQPHVNTDKNGVASFKVTYPDDISSWNAHFIAVGPKKRQMDKKQLFIKSYKNVSAKLSLPQFAVKGDKFNAIGKLTNYTPDSIHIERNIEMPTNELLEKKQMSFHKSHIDSIPVVVNDIDTLSVIYSFLTDGGYFDGEERSIPIFEPGVSEAEGEFIVLNEEDTHNFEFDSKKGKIVVHAETTPIETILREVEKLESYPYYCNEQMASKIKALIAKKRIYEALGRKFEDGEKIEDLVRRLNKNSNKDGLWGWWNVSGTEFWISRQVVEAMIEAEAEGYEVKYNKQAAIDYGVRELERSLSNMHLVESSKRKFAKSNLIDYALFLRKIDPELDVEKYGIDTYIDADSLLSSAKRTMMNSMYWDVNKGMEIQPRYIFDPNSSTSKLTIENYKRLKAIGGYEKELAAIRNYFFEIRRGGYWQNTYLSSLIMETILPDLLDNHDKSKETSLNINGKEIKQFPYTEEIETEEPLVVKKTGALPIFFTAYQQYWNPEPEAVSKGFTVRSAFKNDGDKLTAGQPVQLEVVLTLNESANYVMLEIPIPAGCSYENKTPGNSFKEVHREYFKEKVSVFCKNLGIGEHTFTVNLLPRYSGTYILNPARAELMYFPTFYGHEAMKIKEIGDRR
ncbi:TonB-dependent receptor plug domain-containing protein [Bacteroidales bacterium OttesenSCG-928-I14]|nr:TonB-dependent receptor plug domain-containing protein [Bacteroidales bacterium OttesenSCG-928-I14]